MKTLLAALILVLPLAACAEPEGDPAGLGSQSPEAQPSTRTGEPSSAEPTTSLSPQPGQLRPRVVGTVARDLEAPWGITFLPDGTALVSERDTTRVVAVPADGGEVREVGRVTIAAPQGEAGLLGLAASPDFAEDSLV